MKVTCLTESVFSSGAKVDREAGIIRGVKILGRESKNRRQYSDRALQEAAKLYEGVDVNLSHPGRNDPGNDIHGNAPVERGFGWLQSVNVKDDGVYGDLHYFKSHPYSGVIAESAERNPRRFGLSHNAFGKTNRGANGREVVETMESVKSVDIVQNPATTRGLFESDGRTIREVFEQHAPELLTSLLEDSALLPPESMDQPMQVEAPAGKDPGAQVKAAIVQLLTAALDSDGDPRAVVLKIMDTAQALLAGLPNPEEKDPEAQSDENGDPVGNDPNVDPSDPNQQTSEPAADDPSGSDPANPGDKNPFQQRKKKMAESTKTPAADPAVKQLMESVGKLTETVGKLTAAQEEQNARSAARALLESSNRDASEIRINTLAGVKDEAARKALVESWPEKQPEPSRYSYGQRPAVSAPLRESAGSEAGKYPADHKSFLAAIR